MSFSLVISQLARENDFVDDFHDCVHLPEGSSRFIDEQCSKTPCLPCVVTGYYWLVTGFPVDGLRDSPIILYRNLAYSPNYSSTQRSLSHHWSDHFPIECPWYPHVPLVSLWIFPWFFPCETSPQVSDENHRLQRGDVRQRGEAEIGHEDHTLLGSEAISLNGETIGKAIGKCWEKGIDLWRTVTISSNIRSSLFFPWVYWRLIFLGTSKRNTRKHWIHALMNTIFLPPCPKRPKTGDQPGNPCPAWSHNFLSSLVVGCGFGEQRSGWFGKFQTQSYQWMVSLFNLKINIKQIRHAKLVVMHLVYPLH